MADRSRQLKKAPTIYELVARIDYRTAELHAKIRSLHDQVQVMRDRERRLDRMLERMRTAFQGED